MDQNKIYIYGRELLQKYPDKKIEIYDTGTELTNEDEILDFVKRIIGIKNMRTVYTIKCNTINQSMNPHLDDYQLVKRSEISYNHDQYIHLKDNWYLFRNKPEKPILSCIYYMSTQDIEFGGGELVFVDETVIPKMGKLVVFESEYFVHYVNPIKWGTRKCMLIKFYL